MNPTVARGGSSFRGAFLYYMHDPQAATRERIAWTHSVNMLTHNPDQAWKVMAYTAKHQDRLKEAAGVKLTGRKAEKPVLAYSLSWHPEQTPSPDHMRETALSSLKVLGLKEHEAFIVAHSDTKHRHVHVIANRIHPLTGKVASDSYLFLKLSDFALQYSHTHGLHYSPQRADNKRKREEGKQSRYRDPKIAEAWAATTGSTNFAEALAVRGYALAQGGKRLVVVDPYGKIHNPIRHLEGIRAKDLKTRLQNLDLARLPEAEAIAQKHEAAHQKSKAEQRKLNKTFGTAAHPEKAPATEPTARNTTAKAEDIDRISRLQQRQQKEHTEVIERYRARLERQNENLARHFRLHELEHRISQLRAKCENPGFFRRLFGFARRDRRALEKLETNYAGVKTNIQERARVLQDGHTRTMELLQITQQKELDAALRTAFQKTKDPLPSREPERPRTDKARDPGPTLER